MSKAKPMMDVLGGGVEGDP